jgi:archaeal flagellin FlaB
VKRRFTKTIGTFYISEKGITGLETAIILIAFVTVAAVLAYSVLSAGIFSSEKGKQAVYSGLEQAKATMDIVGNVKAMGNVSDGNVSTLKFEVTSVLDDSDIDMGKIIMNYTDDEVTEADIIFTHTNLTGISDDLLAQSDVALITINLSDIAGANLTAYDSFTLELIPSTGATITIQRTMPGDIREVMDLH